MIRRPGGSASAGDPPCAPAAWCGTRACGVAAADDTGSHGSQPAPAAGGRAPEWAPRRVARSQAQRRRL